MTKKVVVIIHGAGDQPANYPEDEVKALETELGYRPDYLVARYDDVATGCSWHKFGEGDTRIAVERATEHWERAIRLRATLQEYVETGQLPEVEGRVTLRSLPAGLKPTIEDCIRYLLADPSFQDAVQARLIEPLQKAAAEYDETILVSHSMGTVVSFDVLKKHVQSFPLSTWFTMGSPLRWLVGLKLHSGDLGQINTQTVRFWHNLYDTTDLIADSLAPAFPDYDLYDDFEDVSDEFPEAHHYWSDPDVVRIIANTLR
ncbi:MAG: hypothetical protein KKA73_05015 [Chloroflexi bacterium]|nr:hypothetical protein [Chloroflexota bacterium]MBU1747028.1 hypothetical protein [Chloroflexota bacterium]MBU1878884.1 hypothetical protein [Chloroflexota bacterium]